MVNSSYPKTILLFRTECAVIAIILLIHLLLFLDREVKYQELMDRIMTLMLTASISQRGTKSQESQQPVRRPIVLTEENNSINKFDDL